MKHMVRGLGARVTGSVFLAIVVASFPVTATSPTVVAGVHNGDIAINGGSYAAMATLSVPKGNWLIVAKAQVHGTGALLGRVFCRLVADGDFDEVSTAPNGGGLEGDLEPIVMTVVHHFPTAGSTHVDCYRDASGGIPYLSNLKITATKAGKLTNTQMGGSGSSHGSGSPRVISAWRDASASHSGNGSYQSVGQMNVPRGRWWIIAKAQLEGPAVGLVPVLCQLKAGSDVDLSRVGLAPTSTQTDVNPISAQIVHVFSSKTPVRFRCKADAASWEVRHVKITAVQAGTLTNRVLGGSSSTSGSGTPRIIGGHRNGPVSMCAALICGVETLGSMSLAAGSWEVYAKVRLENVSGAAIPVDCYLYLGGQYRDFVPVYLGGGNVSGIRTIYLQAARHLATGGKVELSCAQGGSSGDIVARNIRITAIRAGGLTVSGI
jgi:hypothetical protein